MILNKIRKFPGDIFYTVYKSEKELQLLTEINYNEELYNRYDKLLTNIKKHTVLKNGLLFIPTNIDYIFIRETEIDRDEYIRDSEISEIMNKQKQTIYKDVPLLQIGLEIIQVDIEGLEHLREKLLNYTELYKYEEHLRENAKERYNIYLPLEYDCDSLKALFDNLENNVTENLQGEKERIKKYYDKVQKEQEEKIEQDKIERVKFNRGEEFKTPSGNIISNSRYKNNEVEIQFHEKIDYKDIVKELVKKGNNFQSIIIRTGFDYYSNIVNFSLKYHKEKITVTYNNKSKTWARIGDIHNYIVEYILDPSKIQEFLNIYFCKKKNKLKPIGEYYNTIEIMERENEKSYTIPIHCKCENGKNNEYKITFDGSDLVLYEKIQFSNNTLDNLKKLITEDYTLSRDEKIFFFKLKKSNPNKTAQEILDFIKLNKLLSKY